MSRKNIPTKQKLKAVHEYLKGNTFFAKLGRKSGINERSIRSWITKYKARIHYHFYVDKSNTIFPTSLTRVLECARFVLEVMECYTKKRIP